MKKIAQFRYRGQNSDGTNHPDNFPQYEFYIDKLTDGNIFQDFGPVTHLGIQAPVGIKFYLNSSPNPIMIGQTGIYELDLENIGRISSIRFDRTDLNNYYTDNARNDMILIDIVYEGAR